MTLERSCKSELAMRVTRANSVSCIFVMFRNMHEGLDMNVHTSRINPPDKNMSAISLAQTLERRERKATGSAENARRSLANKLKVGIGTIENLVRGRVKRVDAAVRDRLQALLIRELELEIARLSHELEIARQCGAHLADSQISEIETHLAKATALLKLH